MKKSRFDRIIIHPYILLIKVKCCPFISAKSNFTGIDTNFIVKHLCSQRSNHSYLTQQERDARTRRFSSFLPFVFPFAVTKESLVLQDTHDEASIKVKLVPQIG